MRFAIIHFNVAGGRAGQQTSGCVSPLLRFCLLLGVMAFSSSFANAEGFRNSPPGAFDLGRAGGRFAQVDDSSAVQQNPANLVDLTNAEVQITPTVVYIHADFRSPGGQTASTINPWKFLPNVFA